MPQFVPFYFVNQFSFGFLALMAAVYILGTYVLPVFTELYVSRMYITKL